MKIVIETDLTSNKITNVATPTADTDAANKAYVDDNIGNGDMTKAAYDTNADNIVDSADTAAALIGIDAPTPLAGDDGKYLKYVHATTEYILSAPAGAGDMTKIVYDTDDDGTVDAADTATTATTAETCSGNAATVTTNANLTGDVTSVGNATTIGASKVTEAMQVLADNTTNNVSTSKHGYAPKGDGVTTKYLNANGAYSTPAGAGDVTGAAVFVDNTLIKGDGGGKGVQDTGITVDDSENVTGIANLGSTGTRVTKGWFTDIKTTNMIDSGPLTLSTFTTDHTYIGHLTIESVAESAGQFGLLYLHSTGYKKALANADATVPCTAVQCTAGTGVQTLLKLHGWIRDASWSFTVGQLVWVDPTTAGAITAVKPTTSGQMVQCVGQAIGTNVIEFDLTKPWVEVT